MNIFNIFFGACSTFVPVVTANAGNQSAVTITAKPRHFLQCLCRGTGMKHVAMTANSKYDVTFDMFSKISVKGDDQHPLYRYLTSARTDPKFSGDVKWNFQKYLVDRKGNIVGKFASSVDPLSSEITSAIEQVSGAK